MGGHKQRNPKSLTANKVLESPPRFEIWNPYTMEPPLHPIGPIPQSRSATQASLLGSDGLPVYSFFSDETSSIRQSGNRSSDVSPLPTWPVLEGHHAFDAGGHSSGFTSDYNTPGGSTYHPLSQFPTRTFDPEFGPAETSLQSPPQDRSLLTVPSKRSCLSQSGSSDATIVAQPHFESAGVAEPDHEVSRRSALKQPRPTMTMNISHSQKPSGFTPLSASQSFASPTMPWIFDGKVIRINFKFRNGEEIPCLAKCCLGRQYSLADIRIVQNMPLKRHPVHPQRRMNQTTEKAPKSFCFFDVAEVENIGRIDLRLNIQLGRLGDQHVSIELGYEALAQLGCVSVVGLAQGKSYYIARPIRVGE